MVDKKISIGISDSAGFNRNFTSLKELLVFCKDEAEFWRSEDSINSNQSKRSHGCFSANNIFTSIISGIDDSSTLSDDQLSNAINHILSSQRAFLSNHWIWSAHGFTKSFLDVLEKHGEESANAFFSLVVHRSVRSINNSEILIGLISGYEYITQNSEIFQRRNSEKQSINQLRDRLEKAQEKLFSEIADSQEDFSEWDAGNREEAKTVIQNHKEANEQQAITQDKNFEEKLREWNTSITALENTYEEKLRLDKPAQYWNKAAVRYNKQGWTWVTAIVLLVFFALINFQDFFVHWLNGKELELKLNSFQGVILFGSIVATYAFVLRIFSRLAFSSFHLMRDAQEREQLTYLYLSLSNEAAIDKESRDIVLQALFSRSETGLLAQEHGPTMPGIDTLKNTVTK
ncbi:hypothetical protein O59_001336 [Cellvibrio sp. BR]|uniref:DUF6161 domain-containing protein n=1 Tax=unclassified Cellvibrio TaxID=2624793 RepID=UPI00026011B9|nr:MULTISPECIES: DUF6161 domain-containing protein [unclassified Cellvibrio]EIK45697.1 hypothetical protein O59_001336 [Cellvibrio sp. BR]UUA73970.1 DUF6161 domain-containing protein [Cellvibrio sp. QJXJ]